METTFTKRVDVVRLLFKLIAKVVNFDSAIRMEIYQIGFVQIFI